MIEIHCDSCGVWSEDRDVCPCGEERGEYVLFRGPEADAVLIPIAMRCAGATVNEAALS